MTNLQTTNAKLAADEPALSAFLRFVVATSPGDEDLLQVSRDVESEESQKMDWGQMLDVAALRIGRKISTKEDEVEFSSLGFFETDED